MEEAKSPDPRFTQDIQVNQGTLEENSGLSYQRQTTSPRTCIGWNFRRSLL